MLGWVLDIRKRHHVLEGTCLAKKDPGHGRPCHGNPCIKYRPCLAWADAPVTKRLRGIGGKGER
jgi:hypothetical protein